MKASFLSTVFAVALMAHPAFADDSAVASQLRALGGEVTLADGKATKIVFKDCSKLGDDEFRAIGQLAHLKVLTLYGKCHGLNDSTVKHLTGLHELEELGTDGAQFTDEGLKHLATLKALKRASFFHTSFGMKGFTGVGFGALKGCPKLERLTVAGISMSDDGFAAIATITQLRDFSTWHTYQTEAGNAHIAKLPNLKALKMGQRLPGGGRKAPSLSDASITTFASMKTLETLNLGEARFTFEVLKQLKSLPKLKQLTLPKTEIPPADIEKLSALLPDVKIEWQPPTDEDRKFLKSYLGS